MMSHDPGDHWKPEVAEQAAIWRVLTTLVQDVAALAKRVTRLERNHPQQDLDD